VSHASVSKEPVCKEDRKVISNFTLRVCLNCMVIHARRCGHVRSFSIE